MQKQKQRLQKKWNPIVMIEMYIIFTVLITHVSSLSSKLSMDTTGTDQLISSYNADMGSCGCDIHQSSCDIFCCCDTSCSQFQTSTWSGNQLCSNSQNTLEKSCDNLGSGGQLSFDDLACVYYSNRGNISYFYSYPDSGSVNYPSPDKFVARTVLMEPTNVGSSTTSQAYSEGHLRLKVNKTQNTLRFMEIWAPVANGGCELGFVNISSSQSFSCNYALNSRTCPLSTYLFSNSMQVCKNGQCSDKIAFPTFKVADSPGSVCTNFVTSQTIDITVSSSGSSYIIDTITIKLEQKDIDMTVHKRYQVKTAINVKVNTASVSYSGNPGYLMNKRVTVEKSGSVYSLLSVADGSGNCVLNSNINGIQSREILFGQNKVYSCVSANPCEEGLYIDQIAKQPLTIRRWAKSSENGSVFVSGTGAQVNTCNYQQIVLNVLYSTAGWIADSQNYILGAQLTTSKASSSSWNKKYLRVNWIYVDPNSISNPPQNNFYEYFAYIWKPLREYFGVY